MNRINAAEILSQFLTHDVLAKDQFNDLHRKIIIADSEKALLMAVLEDAIKCISKYRCESETCKEGKARRSTCRLFHEAKAWILSDEKDLMSFDVICDTLGFSPDYLRDELVRTDFVLPKKMTERTETRGNRQQSNLEGE